MEKSVISSVPAAITALPIPAAAPLLPGQPGRLIQTGLFVIRFAGDKLFKSIPYQLFQDWLIGAFFIYCAGELCYICTSLKGRIQYFATRYRESHDQEGRVAIWLDGEEIFQSSYFDWLKKRCNITETHAGQRNNINIEVINQGSFDQYIFYETFYQYQSMKMNLASGNPIVRLFAILDKRTGKRTLQNMPGEIEVQPEWL